MLVNLLILIGLAKEYWSNYFGRIVLFTSIYIYLISNQIALCFLPSQQMLEFVALNLGVKISSIVDFHTPVNVYETHHRFTFQN